MSAPVTIVWRPRRRGWSVIPHEGPYAGRIVAMIADVVLTDVEFGASPQTRVDGRLKHDEATLAGCVRVERRGTRYHRRDTGERVTKAQLVWASPLGNLFAIGLE